jgi:hypothetical protein
LNWSFKLEASVLILEVIRYDKLLTASSQDDLAVKGPLINPVLAVTQKLHKKQIKNILMFVIELI